MKLEDLTEQQAIHCKTQEQWDYLISLNPNNDLSSTCWTLFGENTLYIPAGNEGKGLWSSLSFFDNDNVFEFELFRQHYPKQKCDVKRCDVIILWSISIIVLITYIVAILWYLLN